jgi:hypothetical protein
VLHERAVHWLVHQLFLDCDGVLADFDTAAERLFHMGPREAEARLGTKAFWSRLRNHKDFYSHLPLMHDAMRLFDAVAHLDPIILTGCPMGGWAEQQKVDGAARHFPGVKIITCRSREKCQFLQNPGDILVDDYLKFQHLWEEAGGVFVHHHSAQQSLERLAELGLPVGKLIT